jgi:hypothetical protein
MLSVKVLYSWSLKEAKLKRIFWQHSRENLKPATVTPSLPAKARKERLRTNSRNLQDKTADNEKRNMPEIFFKLLKGEP